MSRHSRKLAVALHHATGEQVRKARPVARAIVLEIKPDLVVERVGASTIIGDDEDLNLSTWAQHYDDVVGIAIGDTVVLAKEDGDWLVMDVADTDSDLEPLKGAKGGGGSSSSPARALSGAQEARGGVGGVTWAVDGQLLLLTGVWVPQAGTVQVPEEARPSADRVFVAVSGHQPIAMVLSSGGHLGTSTGLEPAEPVSLAASIPL